MINNFFVLIKISFLKVDSVSFMVSVAGVELYMGSSYTLLATSVRCGGKQYDHQAQGGNVFFLKHLLRNSSVHCCCWSKTGASEERTNAVCD